jgi:peptidoglycan/xylan/chitin deacetylase (PgdA/CDA1 family)
VGSNFFIPITCSAKTDKKEIAISFDDGPAVQFTPEILQVLKEYDVKATFFCIGKRIAGNENLFRQIHEEGHIIGNHSFSHHFWFDMYSAKKMRHDLQLMDEAMQNVIGLKPRLFRPPYGVTNPNVKKAILHGQYIPIGWSLRSMDTVTGNEEQLLQKTRKGIQPGAIFLFHDTSRTTLSILPQFIKEVKDRGYTIIGLDKMLNLQPYA